MPGIAQAKDEKVYIVPVSISYDQQHEIGALEHHGVLEGLVLALRDRERHHVHRLAEIVDRGTHQVPHVLDEQHVEGLPREVVKGVVHQGRIEVAYRTRGDAVGGDPRRPKPLGVAKGGQIRRDGAEAPAAGGPRGRLQDRGLAGARRAHKVHGEHAVPREMLPVVPGAPVVAREQALVHVHGDDLGIAAATDLAHQGTSSSMRSRTIPSPA